MIDAYYVALMRCCERYGQMMTGPSDDLSAFNNVTFADAIRDRLPLPKLCRWLGYIQGCLIERGLTTVEAERDWTRPLFRPLDFADQIGPWTCFHCGETFFTPETAKQHFGEGNYEREEPVCIEAATTELKTLVIHTRELWERLQKVEAELEQAEHERDNARYTLGQPKFARFEEIEGRMLAAESALNAGPAWLRRLLRWNAERRWQKGRHEMERLRTEAEHLMAVEAGHAESVVEDRN